MNGIDVVRWNFWSPESSDPARWLDRWRTPGAEPADGNPVVEQIPPMQRRRMSRLTKMALAVALDVTVDAPVDYSIFCSQHGEIVRTREILASISDGTEISPTAFAQSVHNTSSGLYTIIAKSNHASTSIASGANSFAHAWLEAQAYLAGNPEHRVLLIDFDEVIPEEYRAYSQQVDCDHALAMLLTAAGEGGIEMTRVPDASDQDLPQGPQFLAWIQSGKELLTLGADGQGWQWAR
jgi:hypothetical protein